MTDHSDMVRALKKNGSDIKQETTSAQASTVHMAVGICTEAGELLSALKKWWVYRKVLDIENVIEELGDLEFYMEGIRQDLDISREETLAHNINKLGDRYEGFKYSDQQAIDRADKDE